MRRFINWSEGEEIVPSVIHQCVVEALTIRNLVFADIWNPERGKIDP
jgi:hypothetical protein